MQEIRYHDKSFLDIFADKTGKSIEELKEEFGFKPETINAEMEKRMDKRLAEVKAEHGEPVQVVRRKVGRNEPCPCGSGTKFKKCCIHKAQ